MRHYDAANNFGAFMGNGLIGPIQKMITRNDDPSKDVLHKSFKI